jgi:indolepyruvate decarboxylase
MNVSALLFAYGTLMPRDRDSAERGGWRPDAVRGRLFDLGPYPALIDLDDPKAGWVEGFVRPVDLEELETRLDPWEEVDRGVFRRIQTVTRGSCLAWVYVYGRPLPLQARGPVDRWDGRRRAPASVMTDRVGCASPIGGGVPPAGDAHPTPHSREEAHDGEHFAAGHWA